MLLKIEINEMYGIAEKSSEKRIREIKSLLSVIEELEISKLNKKKDTSNKAHELLKKHEEQTFSLRPVFSKTMELIQNQDIIRQSIQHILLSLNEIRIQDNTSAEIEARQYLVSNKTAELSLDLFEDIEEQFSKTYLALTESIEQIHEKISQSHMDYYSSIRTTMSENNSCFDIKDIIAKTEELINAIDGNLNDSDKITKSLLLLERFESHLLSLNNLATRLNTLAVTARIEISKNLALTELKSAVDSLFLYSDTVGKICQSLHTTLVSVIGRIKKLSVAIMKNFYEQETINSDLQLYIRETMTDKAQHCKILADSIQNENPYSHRQKHCLQKLVQSSKNLVDIMNLFADTKQKMTEITRTLKTNSQNINFMEAEHSAMLLMERIITRFTIYKHKYAGAKTAGLELGMDQEKEDIVFF